MNLDQKKMARIQEDILQLLIRGNAPGAEGIFALGELAGRLIATQAGSTWIEKKDIFEALLDHMNQTVIEGLKATGHTVEEPRIVVPH